MNIYFYIISIIFIIFYSLSYLEIKNIAQNFKKYSIYEMFRNVEKIYLLSLLLSYFLLFGLVNIEYYNFSFKYLLSDNFFDKIKYFRSLIPFL